MDHSYKRRIPGHSETSEVVCLNSNPTTLIQEDIVTLSDAAPFVLPAMNGRREFLFQLLTDGYLWLGVGKANVAVEQGLRIGGSGSIFGVTVADRNEQGIVIPISFIADTGSAPKIVVWQMGV